MGRRKFGLINCVIMTTMISSFLVSGCNAMKQHQAHEKQEEMAAQNEKSKQQAVSPAPPTQPVNETHAIPKSLESIEKNAEDMIDVVCSGMNCRKKY
jgi:hypothetical protein